jgi:hypothetical protein
MQLSVPGHEQCTAGLPAGHSMIARKVEADDVGSAARTRWRSCCTQACKALYAGRRRQTQLAAHRRQHAAGSTQVAAGSTQVAAGSRQDAAGAATALRAVAPHRHCRQWRGNGTTGRGAARRSGAGQYAGAARDGSRLTGEPCSGMRA